MSRSVFPHEEGGDDRLSPEVEKEHVKHVRRITERFGFPLSKWTPQRTRMSNIDKLVKERGPIAINYKPQNYPHPFTVTILTPISQTGEGDVFDHSHGRSIEETAGHLLAHLVNTDA